MAHASISREPFCLSAHGSGIEEIGKGNSLGLSLYVFTVPSLSSVIVITWSLSRTIWLCIASLVECLAGGLPEASMDLAAGVLARG